MTKVFVYGTLRAGFGNNRLLQRSDCAFVQEDWVDSAVMYSMGGFPGVCMVDEDLLVTGEAWPVVVGEVWEVSDDALVRLNRLEGFREPDSPDNFYNRVTVTTQSGVECLMYTQDSPPSTNLIRSGDWVEHMQLHRH